MKKIPHIVVELIHIEGPLKGEIQEFSGLEINIGRHPSCHCRMPKELTIISRYHAKISREGNRFRITDQSTNGTFVNGRRVTESYLKDGDVIIFAEGGPKASFLTRVEEGEYQAPEIEPPPAPPAPKPSVQPSTPQPPRPQRASSPVKPAAPAVTKSQTPLIIQYGPTLQSYKTLPVTIGGGAICDFTVNHPGLSKQHAQIFFHDNQYWIKDLTSGNITLNESAIKGQAPLNAEDVIQLCDNGPAFRFLGGGRLAEVEAPEPDKAPLTAEEPERQAVKNEKHAGKAHPLKKTGAIFKKIFK